MIGCDNVHCFKALRGARRSPFVQSKNQAFCDMSHVHKTDKVEAQAYLDRWDKYARTVPIKVSPFAGIKISAITAGAHHTVLMSVFGDVLTFGSGENGRLGHGTTQNKTLPTQVRGGWPTRFGELRPS